VVAEAVGEKDHAQELREQELMVVQVEAVQVLDQLQVQAEQEIHLQFHPLKEQMVEKEVQMVLLGQQLEEVVVQEPLEDVEIILVQVQVGLVLMFLQLWQVLLVQQDQYLQQDIFLAAVAVEITQLPLVEQQLVDLAAVEQDQHLQELQ
jgi:hypothetical protein